MITTAFTCSGHYAILIMLGIKRVENRNVLPTSSKGRISADCRSLREAKSLERCAISCSKSFTKEEYGEFVRWAARALSTAEFETIPAWNEVFCTALTVGAKSIIVAHNHPSGDLTPSLQDRQLTAILTALGDQLGIKLLDHIVLGCDREYSSIGVIEG